MMYLRCEIRAVETGGYHKSVNLQSMDDTGNPTQDGQQDVDPEVGIAATLKEDT